MNLYRKQLEMEGFTSGNAARVAKAIDVLHTAISKMDRDQLRLFCKTKIESRLKQFAALERLIVFNMEILGE